MTDWGDDPAELRALRGREGETESEAARDAPEATEGSPALLALTTTVSSYPTTANSYFACVPCDVLGSETEGGAATVTTDSGTFYALNIGSTVPPSGTQVLCTFVGNRWVFRYDS